MSSAKKINAIKTGVYSKHYKRLKIIEKRNYIGSGITPDVGIESTMGVATDNIAQYE